MLTYRQVKVHKFVILTAIPLIFIQDVSHMYINTSFKYHRVTCTQSYVVTKVHDLQGQVTTLVHIICIDRGLPLRNFVLQIGGVLELF